MRPIKLVAMFSLVFLLAVSFAITTSEYNTPSLVEPVNTNPHQERVLSASVIEITSNSEFAAAGFTGTGTEGDPYVLDGEFVDVPNSDTGIYISGTTSHFIIQNCQIITSAIWGETGIHLVNVSNGTVDNCEILGLDDYGIRTQNCNDVNITRNIVDDTFNAIYIETTPFVNILNNSLSNLGRYGIYDNLSPNGTISDNTILAVNVGGNPGRAGIFTKSSNQTISNNEIRTVYAGSGIEVENGQDVRVENNVINDVTNGAWISQSVSTIFTHNNISCAFRGIVVIESQYPTITENRIHHTDSDAGIYYMTSGNGTIQFNDIFKCDTGIWMFDDSGDNTITNNNIGWCETSTGYDDRTTSPQNSWVSNAFNDFSGNPYSIDGTAGVNDASASLLTDITNPSIDSPDDIIIDSTDTDQWVTWHPQDTFQNNYSLFVNTTNEDANDWCDESISFSLDALDPGVYNYELWVFDCENNSISDIVVITVVDKDVPIFTSFTDSYAIERGEQVWVNFTATDYAPGLKMAWTDNQGPSWNDGWSSSVEVTWDLVTPDVGIHNYTVQLTDVNGNSATNTCLVTVVDTTAPVVIDYPSDFQGEAGVIAWVNFTLNDYYPDTYEIWIDDAINRSLAFIDGEEIFVMLNYTTLGQHNITLVAWDDYGNTVNATCIVTYVDTTAPLISGPDDFTYEAGESPLITWVWEEYTPTNWTVYENGTEITFSTTFSGDILYSLGGLVPGRWNVTLMVFDDNGYFTTDEVWVQVVDTTAPTLVGTDQIPVEVGEEINVIWNVNDIDAWDQVGSWHIFVNDTEMISGIWNSAEITFSFTPDVAVYNITIIVFDYYGNSVVYTIWVTCTDTTSPEITGPENQEMDVGDSIVLNWTCSDFRPDSFVLSVNGSTLLEQDWNGDDFIYLVTGLSPGTYIYTLYIFDTTGNSVSDTVTIHVTSTGETLPVDDGGALAIGIAAGLGGIVVVIILIAFLQYKKK
ncbi:MAG: right-handed parallel beta-helix repeat-containing protein [Candidatus Thorarchaeota archaeon]